MDQPTTQQHGTFFDAIREALGALQNGAKATKSSQKKLLQSAFLLEKGAHNIHWTGQFEQAHAFSPLLTTRIAELESSLFRTHQQNLEKLRWEVCYNPSSETDVAHMSWSDIATVVSASIADNKSGAEAVKLLDAIVDAADSPATELRYSGRRLQFMFSRDILQNLWKGLEDESLAAASGQLLVSLLGRRFLSNPEYLLHPPRPLMTRYTELLCRRGLTSGGAIPLGPGDAKPHGYLELLCKLLASTTRDAYLENALNTAGGKPNVTVTTPTIIVHELFSTAKAWLDSTNRNVDGVVAGLIDMDVAASSDRSASAMASVASLFRSGAGGRGAVELWIVLLSMLTTALERRGRTAHAALRAAGGPIIAFATLGRVWSELERDKRALSESVNFVLLSLSTTSAAYCAERGDDVVPEVLCHTAQRGSTLFTLGTPAPLHGVPQPLGGPSAPSLDGVGWGLGCGDGMPPVIPCVPGTASAVPLHLPPLNAVTGASLPAALLGAHSICPRLNRFVEVDVIVPAIMQLGEHLLKVSVLRDEGLRTVSGALLGIAAPSTTAANALMSVDGNVPPSPYMRLAAESLYYRHAAAVAANLRASNDDPYFGYRGGGGGAPLAPNDVLSWPALLNAIVMGEVPPSSSSAAVSVGVGLDASLESGGSSSGVRASSSSVSRRAQRSVFIVELLSATVSRHPDILPRGAPTAAVIRALCSELEQCRRREDDALAAVLRALSIVLSVALSCSAEAEEAAGALDRRSNGGGVGNNRSSVTYGTGAGFSRPLLPGLLACGISAEAVPSHDACRITRRTFALTVAAPSDGCVEALSHYELGMKRAVSGAGAASPSQLRFASRCALVSAWPPSPSATLEGVLRTAENSAAMGPAAAAAASAPAASASLFSSTGAAAAAGSSSAAPDSGGGGSPTTAFSSSSACFRAMGGHLDASFIHATLAAAMHSAVDMESKAWGECIGALVTFLIPLCATRRDALAQSGLRLLTRLLALHSPPSERGTAAAASAAADTGAASTSSSSFASPYAPYLALPQRTLLAVSTLFPVPRTHVSPGLLRHVFALPQLSDVRSSARPLDSRDMAGVLTAGKYDGSVLNPSSVSGTAELGLMGLLTSVFAHEIDPSATGPETVLPLLQQHGQHRSSSSASSSSSHVGEVTAVQLLSAAGYEEVMEASDALLGFACGYTSHASGSALAPALEKRRALRVLLWLMLRMRFDAREAYTRGRLDAAESGLHPLRLSIASILALLCREGGGAASSSSCGVPVSGAVSGAVAAACLSPRSTADIPLGSCVIFNGTGLPRGSTAPAGSAAFACVPLLHSLSHLSDPELPLAVGRSIAWEWRGDGGAAVRCFGGLHMGVLPSRTAAQQPLQPRPPRRSSDEEAAPSLRSLSVCLFLGGVCETFASIAGTPLLTLSSRGRTGDASTNCSPLSAIVVESVCATPLHLQRVVHLCRVLLIAAAFLDVPDEGSSSDNGTAAAAAASVGSSIASLWRDALAGCVTYIGVHVQSILEACVVGKQVARPLAAAAAASSGSSGSSNSPYKSSTSSIGSGGGGGSSSSVAASSSSSSSLDDDILNMGRASLITAGLASFLSELTHTIRAAATTAAGAAHTSVPLLSPPCLSALVHLHAVLLACAQSHASVPVVLCVGSPSMLTGKFIDAVRSGALDVHDPEQQQQQPLKAAAPAAAIQTYTAPALSQSQSQFSLSYFGGGPDWGAGAAAAGSKRARESDGSADTGGRRSHSQHRHGYDGDDGGDDDDGFGNDGRARGAAAGASQSQQPLPSRADLAAADDEELDEHFSTGPSTSSSSHAKIAAAAAAAAAATAAAAAAGDGDDDHNDGVGGGGGASSASGRFDDSAGGGGAGPSASATNVVKQAYTAFTSERMIASLCDAVTTLDVYMEAATVCLLSAHAVGPAFLKPLQAFVSRDRSAAGGRPVRFGTVTYLRHIAVFGRDVGSVAGAAAAACAAALALSTHRIVALAAPLFHDMVGAAALEQSAACCRDRWITHQHQQQQAAASTSHTPASLAVCVATAAGTAAADVLSGGYAARMNAVWRVALRPWAMSVYGATCRLASLKVHRFKGECAPLFDALTLCVSGLVSSSRAITRGFEIVVESALLAAAPPRNTYADLSPLGVDDALLAYRVAARSATHSTHDHTNLANSDRGDDNGAWADYMAKEPGVPLKLYTNLPFMVYYQRAGKGHPKQVVPFLAGFSAQPGADLQGPGGLDSLKYSAGTLILGALYYTNMYTVSDGPAVRSAQLNLLTTLMEVCPTSSLELSISRIERAYNTNHMGKEEKPERYCANWMNSDWPGYVLGHMGFNTLDTATRHAAGRGATVLTAMYRVQGLFTRRCVHQREIDPVTGKARVMVTAGLPLPPLKLREFERQVTGWTLKSHVSAAAVRPVYLAEFGPDSAAALDGCGEDRYRSALSTAGALVGADCDDSRPAFVELLSRCGHSHPSAALARWSLHVGALAAGFPSISAMAGHAPEVLMEGWYARGLPLSALPHALLGFSSTRACVVAWLSAIVPAACVRAGRRRVRAAIASLGAPPQQQRGRIGSPFTSLMEAYNTLRRLVSQLASSSSSSVSAAVAAAASAALSNGALPLIAAHAEAQEKPGIYGDVTTSHALISSCGFEGAGWSDSAADATCGPFAELLEIASILLCGESTSGSAGASLVGSGGAAAKSAAAGAPGSSSGNNRLDISIMDEGEADEGEDGNSGSSSRKTTPAATTNAAADAESSIFRDPYDGFSLAEEGMPLPPPPSSSTAVDLRPRIRLCGSLMARYSPELLALIVPLAHLGAPSGPDFEQQEGQQQQAGDGDDGDAPSGDGDKSMPPAPFQLIFTSALLIACEAMHRGGHLDAMSSSASSSSSAAAAAGGGATARGLPPVPPVTSAWSVLDHPTHLGSVLTAALRLACGGGNARRVGEAEVRLRLLQKWLSFAYGAESAAFDDVKPASTASLDAFVALSDAAEAAAAASALLGQQQQQQQKANAAASSVYIPVARPLLVRGHSSGSLVRVLLAVRARVNSALQRFEYVHCAFTDQPVAATLGSRPSPDQTLTYFEVLAGAGALVEIGAHIMTCLSEARQESRCVMEAPAAAVASKKGSAPPPPPKQQQQPPRLSTQSRERRAELSELLEAVPAVTRALLGATLQLSRLSAWAPALRCFVNYANLDIVPVSEGAVIALKGVICETAALLTSAATSASPPPPGAYDSSATMLSLLRDARGACAALCLAGVECAVSHQTHAYTSECLLRDSQQQRDGLVTVHWQGAVAIIQAFGAILHPIDGKSEGGEEIGAAAATGEQRSRALLSLRALSAVTRPVLSRIYSDAIAIRSKLLATAANAVCAAAPSSDDDDGTSSGDASFAAAAQLRPGGGNVRARSEGLVASLAGMQSVIDACVQVLDMGRGSGGPVPTLHGAKLTAAAASSSSDSGGSTALLTSVSSSPSSGSSALCSSLWLLADTLQGLHVSEGVLLDASVCQLGHARTGCSDAESGPGPHPGSTCETGCFSPLNPVFEGGSRSHVRGSVGGGSGGSEVHIDALGTGAGVPCSLPSVALAPVACTLARAAHVFVSILGSGCGGTQRQQQPQPLSDDAVEGEDGVDCAYPDYGPVAAAAAAHSRHAAAAVAAPTALAMHLLLRLAASMNTASSRCVLMGERAPSSPLLSVSSSFAAVCGGDTGSSGLSATPGSVGVQAAHVAGLLRLLLEDARPWVQQTLHSAASWSERGGKTGTTATPSEVLASFAGDPYGHVHGHTHGMLLEAVGVVQLDSGGSGEAPSSASSSSSGGGKRGGGNSRDSISDTGLVYSDRVSHDRRAARILQLGPNAGTGWDERVPEELVSLPSSLSSASSAMRWMKRRQRGGATTLTSSSSTAGASSSSSSSLSSSAVAVSAAPGDVQSSMTSRIQCQSSRCTDVPLSFPSVFARVRLLGGLAQAISSAEVEAFSGAVQQQQQRRTDAGWATSPTVGLGTQYSFSSTAAAVHGTSDWIDVDSASGPGGAARTAVSLILSSLASQRQLYSDSVGVKDAHYSVRILPGRYRCALRPFAPLPICDSSTSSERSGSANDDSFHDDEGGGAVYAPATIGFSLAAYAPAYSILAYIPSPCASGGFACDNAPGNFNFGREGGVAAPSFPLAGLDALSPLVWGLGGGGISSAFSNDRGCALPLSSVGRSDLGATMRSSVSRIALFTALGHCWDPSLRAGAAAFADLPWLAFDMFPLLIAAALEDAHALTLQASSSSSSQSWRGPAARTHGDEAVTTSGGSPLLRGSLLEGLIIPNEYREAICGAMRGGGRGGRSHTKLKLDGEGGSLQQQLAAAALQVRDTSALSAAGGLGFGAEVGARWLSRVRPVKNNFNFVRPPRPSSAAAAAPRNSASLLLGVTATRGGDGALHLELQGGDAHDDDVMFDDAEAAQAQQQQLANEPFVSKTRSRLSQRMDGLLRLIASSSASQDDAPSHPPTAPLGVAETLGLMVLTTLDVLRRVRGALCGAQEIASDWHSDAAHVARVEFLEGFRRIEGEEEAEEGSSRVTAAAAAEGEGEGGSSGGFGVAAYLRDDVDDGDYTGETNELGAPLPHKLQLVHHPRIASAPCGETAAIAEALELFETIRAERSKQGLRIIGSSAAARAGGAAAASGGPITKSAIAAAESKAAQSSFAEGPHTGAVRLASSLGLDLDYRVVAAAATCLSSSQPIAQMHSELWCYDALGGPVIVGAEGGAQSSGSGGGSYSRSVMLPSSARELASNGSVGPTGAGVISSQAGRGVAGGSTQPPPPSVSRSRFSMNTPAAAAAAAAAAHFDASTPGLFRSYTGRDSGGSGGGSGSSSGGGIIPLLMRVYLESEDPDAVYGVTGSSGLGTALTHAHGGYQVSSGSDGGGGGGYQVLASLAGHRGDWGSALVFRDAEVGSEQQQPHSSSSALSNNRAAITQGGVSFLFPTLGALGLSSTMQLIGLAGGHSAGDNGGASASTSWAANIAGSPLRIAWTSAAELSSNSSNAGGNGNRRYSSGGGGGSNFNLSGGSETPLWSSRDIPSTSHAPVAFDSLMLRSVRDIGSAGDRRDSGGGGSNTAVGFDSVGEPSFARASTRIIAPQGDLGMRGSSVRAQASLAAHYAVGVLARLCSGVDSDSGGLRNGLSVSAIARTLQLRHAGTSSSSLLSGGGGDGGAWDTSSSSALQTDGSGASIGADEILSSARVALTRALLSRFSTPPSHTRSLENSSYSSGGGGDSVPRRHASSLLRRCIVSSGAISASMLRQRGNWAAAAVSLERITRLVMATDESSVTEITSLPSTTPSPLVHARQQLRVSSSSGATSSRQISPKSPFSSSSATAAAAARPFSASSAPSTAAAAAAARPFSASSAPSTAAAAAAAMEAAASARTLSCVNAGLLQMEQARIAWSASDTATAFDRAIAACAQWAVGAHGALCVQLQCQHAGAPDGVIGGDLAEYVFEACTQLCAALVTIAGWLVTSGLDSAAAPNGGFTFNAVVNLAGWVLTDDDGPGAATTPSSSAAAGSSPGLSALSSAALSISGLMTELARVSTRVLGVPASSLMRDALLLPSQSPSPIAGGAGGGASGWLTGGGAPRSSVSAFQSAAAGATTAVSPAGSPAGAAAAAPGTTAAHADSAWSPYVAVMAGVAGADHHQSEAQKAAGIAGLSPSRSAAACLRAAERIADALPTSIAAQPQQQSQGATSFESSDVAAAAAAGSAKTSAAAARPPAPKSDAATLHARVRRSALRARVQLAVAFYADSTYTAVLASVSSPEQRAIASQQEERGRRLREAQLTVAEAKKKVSASSHKLAGEKAAYDEDAKKKSAILADFDRQGPKAAVKRAALLTEMAKDDAAMREATAIHDKIASRHTTLYTHTKELEAQIKEDGQASERLSKSIAANRERAIRSYAAFLRAAASASSSSASSVISGGGGGSVGDMDVARVVFRLIALWQAHEGDDGVMDVLGSELVRVPGVSFFPALPQIASRLGTDPGPMCALPDVSTLQTQVQKQQRGAKQQQQLQAPAAAAAAASPVSPAPSSNYIPALYAWGAGVRHWTSGGITEYLLLRMLIARPRSTTLALLALENGGRVANEAYRFDTKKIAAASRILDTGASLSAPLRTVIEGLRVLGDAYISLATSTDPSDPDGGRGDALPPPLASSTRGPAGGRGGKLQQHPSASGFLMSEVKIDRWVGGTAGIPLSSLSSHARLRYTGHASPLPWMFTGGSEWSASLPVITSAHVDGALPYDGGASDADAAIAMLGPGGPADYLQPVTMTGWPSHWSYVGTGVSKPRRLDVMGSDGRSYGQIVKATTKGSNVDDMRQDATMEQLFGLVNACLRVSPRAAARRLRLRTYVVVPFSPAAGVVEFVDSTLTYCGYLVDKPFSAHARYHPGEMLPHEARAAMKEPAEKIARLHMRGQPLPPLREDPRLEALASVFSRITPVFHHFFLDFFPSSEAWANAQRVYSRSTATNSMTGYVAGIGDRHVNNILIDTMTGEAVHIDFGLALEQARLLPTPEQVFFRLTRDVVAGMGITGTSGTFLRSCEETLGVLRANEATLCSLMSVIVHDPLYRWALSPDQARRIERRRSSASASVSGGGGDGEGDAAGDSDASVGGGGGSGARDPSIARQLQAASARRQQAAASVGGSTAAAAAAGERGASSSPSSSAFSSGAGAAAGAGDRDALGLGGVDGNAGPITVETGAERAMRRFRQKLVGDDFNDTAGRALSVQSQVQRVVEDHQSLPKLAFMFSGWQSAL